MKKRKVYWVRETVLYRVPAESPEEAKERFYKSRIYDNYRFMMQGEEWFVSTGRWTQRPLDEDPPED